MEKRMKKVTYRGMTYEYESPRDREARLTQIANIGIQAIESELNGLNAYEVDEVMEIMRKRLHCSLIFSSVENVE